MQIINKLECKGFRGFKSTGTLNLAVPNGNPGSGLTILVGPNGGGKSTLVEAFRKMTRATNTSFTEGKRNKASGDRVSIKIDINEAIGELRTIDAGGAETEWDSPDSIQPPSVFFLPSRRVFNPYFSKGNWDRDNYIRNTGDFQYRGQSVDNFNHRLFKALEYKDEFNDTLRRIYGKQLNWTIDQNDQGQYYVKVLKTAGHSHNSDGLGEGIVSLLFITDALFSSSQDEILVIDEPELSLHPQLQRRLLNELVLLAKDRQILIATHSPELVSVPAIINGMEIARVVDTDEGSVIYRLAPECRETFKSLETDLFNPHSFGYESKACLFAEDGIIITEGQEDVVFFGKMASDLGFDPNIPFWGFGAGGSGKIEKIASILQSLGFTNIGAIFDGDKEAEAKSFRQHFSEYRCWILPADDIRDKIDGNGTVFKEGVFGADNTVKEEYKPKCRELLEEIRQFIDRV